MKARIWNKSKQRYDPYELPEGSSIFESDMAKVVACACCGKKIKYGDTYCSHTIHGPMGFGYAVCGECYYDKQM